MENKEMTFEEKMLRLEQIVRAMERGDVPLEQSLQLFQEGTELVRACEKQLNDAQQKVFLISAGADGKPVQEDFTDDR